MAIMDFFTGYEQRLFTKKKRYMALGCILGLAFFFLLRSCFSHPLQEKEYIIGQDGRWRHLNLMGKERNFAAFNNDLLAALSRQEKFGIRIVVTSDLMPLLEQGKLQGILTMLQPDYSNENRLVFSEPYFLTGPVLIIPSAAPLEGWNEQRKKIVGIQAHSSLLFSLEQDPSIQLKIYDDILSALSDLSERRIDGAIFPLIPAYTYVTTFYSDQLTIATRPLNNDGVRLVALKNPEGQLLIQQFNNGLTALKQSGAYQKMLKQWGLIDSEQIILKEMRPSSG